MNFITMHYALQYYFETTDNHEKESLLYFQSCTRNSEISSINSRVKKMLKQKDSLRRFKALLLLHSVLQMEQNTLSKYIDNIETEDKPTKELIDQITKLVYWEHLYSIVINTEMNIRRKYDFLNGSFSVIKGTSIPVQLRTSEFCDEFEKDVAVLFILVADFVEQKIKNGAENVYLQKACDLCIKDLISLCELVLNLDNYKALLTDSLINTEQAELCQSHLITIKNGMKKSNDYHGQLNRIPQITDYKKSFTKFSWFTKKFPITRNFNNLSETSLDALAPETSNIFIVE
ncbi:hypothetical protein EIN_086140 [Entamoeba invadens IP1]|uniref:hypothetical protein n=1 Tax=Entamoeba invadens IP1 TaxID=370355 RepID=UPI0002C3F52A|nr:hypothetical protein EIN_086140 [Entamoeba invadens IP1]ELP85362.1 hypothetical protein EIN_086140 [Entamoeba invadens IP1]|eukprot:XP_004184708.1 hypothetical protein EIN_086140 [Entamoeba invadens IP1]